jgi:hypothetical protein
MMWFVSKAEKEVMRRAAFALRTLVDHDSEAKLINTYGNKWWVTVREIRHDLERLIRN